MKKNLNFIYYLISLIAVLGSIYLIYGVFNYNFKKELSIGFNIVSTLLILISVSLFGYFSKSLYRENVKGFISLNLFFLLPLMLSLLILEKKLITKIPPWPARDLHGVSPEIGGQAWGRIVNYFPESVTNNTWGQRDKERGVKKRESLKRFIFIGDSFLEESSIIPMPLIVDSLLGRQVQVINLGVSMASPVHYYERIKKIALKLNPDHVVVFVFMGNDINSENHTVARIFKRILLGPFPRDYFIGENFPALHYYFSSRYNHTKNVYVDGELHRKEMESLAEFRKDGFKGFRKNLLKYYQGPKELICLEDLNRRNLSNFYNSLVKPDMNLFRTAHFYKLLCQEYHENKIRKDSKEYIGFDNLKVSEINEDFIYKSETYKYISMIRDLLHEKKIPLTLVVIPQGFEVDSRYRDTWSVLKDLTGEIEKLEHTSKIFKRVLKKENIPYIDLYPVLKDTTGTYLNFDGHWSPLGNDLVANHLADYFRDVPIMD